MREAPAYEVAAREAVARSGTKPRRGSTSVLSVAESLSVLGGVFPLFLELVMGTRHQVPRPSRRKCWTKLRGWAERPVDLCPPILVPGSIDDASPAFLPDQLPGTMRVAQDAWIPWNPTSLTYPISCNHNVHRVINLPRMDPRWADLIQALKSAPTETCLKPDGSRES